MISLFEAFTFAPLLTAYFAKPLSHEHRNAHTTATGFHGRWARAWPAISEWYQGVLRWSLGHRAIVMSVAVVLFFIGGWLMLKQPQSFFPNTDPSAISIGISLPPGTALGQTDTIARDIEKFAMAQPEVTRVYSDIGGQSSQYSGSISVTLKDGTPTEPVVGRFRNAMSKYGRTVTFAIPRQFMARAAAWAARACEGVPWLWPCADPSALRRSQQLQTRQLRK